MNVFISWSGKRSKSVAEAFAELLPDAIQEIKTWMSDHDINAGTRWSQDLGRQLETSTIGIICLTKENMNAPWLLFEAGSLAKNVSESRVIPYLIGLKPTDVIFPLAQFQSASANMEGTLKLLKSINSVLESPIPEDRLLRIFERWWQDFNVKLTSFHSSTKDTPEIRSERDPDFEKITIKNLLEMRSGLKYFVGYFPGTHIHLPWHAEAVGYYHPNVRKLLLRKMEIAGEPGKTFQYNNYNTSYLGLIIERVTHKTVSEYLQEKLWSQIMEYDALFSIDSKKSGFEYMPSRLIARAIDYARFGRLFLNEGNWNGKQIISKNWVMKSTREDKSIPRSIYPDWLGGDNCAHTYYTYQ